MFKVVKENDAKQQKKVAFSSFYSDLKSPQGATNAEYGIIDRACLKNLNQQIYSGDLRYVLAQNIGAT